jgi:hypothetical protein
VSADLDDTLAETYYRLAQADKRIGNTAGAKKHLRLHDEFAKKTKQDTELQRREIQEFVISLRSENTTSR